MSVSFIDETSIDSIFISFIAIEIKDVNFIYKKELH